MVPGLVADETATSTATTANNDDGATTACPSDNGDDDDAVDDESDDGDVSDPVEPAETREQADTTRAAAGSGIDPDGQARPGSLTVGGDGIDDLSERVDGVGNVSTLRRLERRHRRQRAMSTPRSATATPAARSSMHIVDSTVSGGNSR